MTDDESALLPWPPCPRPGWTELYGRMIEQLRAVDPDISPQPDGVYVGEGLTVLVRTTAGHDSVWPILCRAAETSLRTCEQCGQPGEWQEWIEGNPVLCDEHTGTTRWPRINAAPGWQPLYRKLRAEVTALDRRAQVSVRQKMGRLHVHVAADPAALQAIRDLCFDAEAESMRTCVVCGAAGTLRGIGEPRRWVRPLCDKHEAMYMEAELHAVLRAADDPTPWPITRVEPRGGTWIRVWHRDGVVADHDLSYLVGGGGVFAVLTSELIQTAQLVDGDTVGWVLADGSVIDLAPDALHEHAVTGACPGGTCIGWTPAYTRLVDVEVAPESEWLAERRRRAEGRS